MSLKDEASWASDKSSQNHTGQRTHTLTLSRTSHLLSECGICHVKAGSGFGTHRHTRWWLHCVLGFEKQDQKDNGPER